jgi:hypothetical protein
MVLGTANAVTTDQSESARRAMLGRIRAEQEAQRLAEEEEAGRGRGGGFDGGRGGFGEGRGMGGGFGRASEPPAEDVNYRTSRFVFVVQVLEAESFAPESGQ